MSVFHPQNWFRLWRGRYVWQQKRREFVYLDEVSVTSLMAAREGSIAESFKNTSSNTTSAESGSNLKVSAPAGGPVTGWNSRIASADTISQEVTRKAIIQGTFRSLRIGDTDLRLSVADQPTRARPKSVDSSSTLAASIARLEKQRRAVQVRHLTRGEVIEVEVELNAEWTYQVAAAVTSILDIVKDNAGAFGLPEGPLADAEVMGELLLRLLVDLVPITARVTSHLQVVIDNEPWLVDKGMIKEGSHLAASATEVAIVGVAELPLFWRDVRRVLFEGSSFTVYARLAKTGVRGSWSPVKLADVVERVFPDVGAYMRALPMVVSSTIPTTTTIPEPPTAAEGLLKHGLIPFGIQLAELAYRDIDEASLALVASEAVRRVVSAEDLADVGIVRSAFAKVVEFVEGSPGVDRGCLEVGSEKPSGGAPTPIDREVVRSLRETHQELARLHVVAGLAAHAISGHEDPEPAIEHLLEVEFIAIYW